jgi:hypothetical protein
MTVWRGQEKQTVNAADSTLPDITRDIPPRQDETWLNLGDDWVLETMDPFTYGNITPILWPGWPPAHRPP